MMFSSAVCFGKVTTARITYSKLASSRKGDANFISQLGQNELNDDT